MRSFDLNFTFSKIAQRLRAVESVQRLLPALCEEICSVLTPTYLECYYEGRRPDAPFEPPTFFAWNSKTRECETVGEIKSCKILDSMPSRELLASVSATSRAGPLTLRRFVVPSSLSVVFLNTSTPGAAAWFHIVVPSSDTEPADIAAIL